MTAIASASIVANARASTTNTVSGCANWVWRMCGSPMNIAHFSNATELANRSSIRYPTFESIPIGGIVYLGPLARPRYAGDVHYADGDVFIKTDANGGYASDAAGAGRPGYITLARRIAQTGRPFAFGFGDLEGIPIQFAATAATAIVTTHIPEDAMSAADVTAITAALTDAIAKMEDAVRRDDRARLYRITDTNELVAIDWRTNPARELYANDGDDQAARWYDPYQLVGDSPAQAKKITRAEFQILLGLARGTDSAYTKK